MLLAGIASVGVAAAEPSVAGLWQKVDEETGKPVGWFLFVDRNGSYEGSSPNCSHTRPTARKPPVCSRCTDDRKDAPVLGISLMSDMKRHGLKYQTATFSIRATVTSITPSCR